MRLATWNVNSLGGPPAPGGRVDGGEPARRALPPGDQAVRRRLPRGGLLRPRLPRRPTTGRGSGTGWPSSAGSGSTTRRPACGPKRRTRRGPGAGRHLRRRPGALGLRAQRPDRGQRALPRQAGVAGPPARVPVRDLPARGPGGGLRGLQRRPHRRRRVGPRRLRRGHPRDRARTGRAGLGHRLGAGRRLPAASTPRAGPSAGGTTAAAPSTRARGCGSTWCCSPRSLAERCSRAVIDREARKKSPAGNKPSDHTPVVVDLEPT